ncbi:hypothetical protein RRG08_046002 [Elysia crispata]|uniref:Uncharacterized protein n=1 Tax=Elysia crispata TaxID=231223 RepID=A0AAE0Z142_9GAST|nr:hypothetical protein RRG08_046002 [Elysia crispata]
MRFLAWGSENVKSVAGVALLPTPFPSFPVCQVFAVNCDSDVSNHRTSATRDRRSKRILCRRTRAPA